MYVYSTQKSRQIVLVYYVIAKLDASKYIDCDCVIIIRQRRHTIDTLRHKVHAKIDLIKQKKAIV